MPWGVCHSYFCDGESAIFVRRAEFWNLSHRLMDVERIVGKNLSRIFLASTFFFNFQIFQPQDQANIQV